MSSEHNQKQMNAERIQLLCKSFQNFLVNFHSSNSSEDQHILDEWKRFKSEINKNPYDLEGLKSYIESMQIIQQQQSIISKRELRIPRSKSRLGLNRKWSVSLIDNFRIDKKKLKDCSRRFMEGVRRNTKMMELN